MVNKMLMPAALAALTISSVAEAQTSVPLTPSFGGGTTVPNTAVNRFGGNPGQFGVNGTFGANNGFNNGFGTPFNTNIAPVFPNGTFANGVQVDPRFSDPRSTFFDPRLNVNGSSLGFTPGVTPGNQFVPGNGFGSGYFYNPWGYSGPLVDTTGAYAAAQNPGFRRMGGIPIAGVNSPPLQPGRFRVTRIVDGGSGSGYDYASRARADALSGTGNPAVAPSRGSGVSNEQLNQSVNVSEIDPQQIRVVNRMEDVMDNRPLTEGMVMSLGSGTVSVRYTQDGNLRVQSFPAAQVFYFQSGGGMATASMANGALQPGDRVLIPVPAQSTIIRQSVAGSRQESRSNGGTRRTSPARRPAR